MIQTITVILTERYRFGHTAIIIHQKVFSFGVRCYSCIAVSLIFFVDKFTFKPFKITFSSFVDKVNFLKILLIHAALSLDRIRLTVFHHQSCGEG